MLFGPNNSALKVQKRRASNAGSDVNVDTIYSF